MAKPKVLVFSGYGLNCEEETKEAFRISGATKADIVHINDLISGDVDLSKYQILAFPGGFSYGDDTGSGKAFANKIKNHLLGKINEFIAQDKLVIGICNGFQILVNLGIFGEVALLHNDNGRYTVRWVDLKVENNSPWLKDLDALSLPIAHGEGKFFTSAKILAKLKQRDQVALKYIDGKICNMQNLMPNPNGSLENIAAITDSTKRILGMMPHPERGMFFTQLPDWPLLKQQLKMKKEKIPSFGLGIKLFKNAIDYFN